MITYKRKLAFILFMCIVAGSVLSACSGNGKSQAASASSGEIETQQDGVIDDAALQGNDAEYETGQLEKTQNDDAEVLSENEEITIDIDTEDSESDENQPEEAEETQEEEMSKDVDLIFFMGQSNMSGCGGDYTQAPKINPGAGYEFRAVSDPYNLNEIQEPFGFAESIVGGIWDVPGAKRGSMVTSFVNRYHEKTGRCVIAVSASAGGTTTGNWLSPGFVTDLSLRVKNTEDYLSSNGYTVKNQYVIWLQGESDALKKTTVDTYKTNMDDIMRPLFVAGFTKVFIITPGQINTNAHFFDNIIGCQIDMCKNSGYYALASTMLCAVPVSYMVDEWHYNQKVLNLLGEESADAVAYYANEGKEMCIYDYKNDNTFIPLLFDYAEDVTVEKKDIAGILEQR